MIELQEGIAPIILRLTLGLVILPHGYLKLMNFQDSLSHLTNVYGVPYTLSIMTILIEFFASIFLIIGFGGRLMAFLIIGLEIRKEKDLNIIY